MWNNLNRKMALLVCGEASDYIKKRMHHFQDTLTTIFREEEFQHKNSLEMTEGFINMQLDIFNRFAEKVNIYLLLKEKPLRFYFRVMIHLPEFTCTFCITG